MPKAIRYILIVLSLAAAMACYLSGVILGGNIFLLFGLVFEIAFWRGLLSRGKD